MLMYIAIGLLVLCLLSGAGVVSAPIITGEPITTTVGKVPGLGFVSQISEQQQQDQQVQQQQQSGASGGIAIPQGTKVIVREVPQPCPNCPTCKCQPCPDVTCPECPDLQCSVTDNQLLAAQAEAKYLKWMVRFIGAIARRENAVNRVMAQQCPGVFGMVPMVQEVDQETQYIQKHIRKDKDMYQYFRSNFSRYSGIPSEMHKEIL